MKSPANFAQRCGVHDAMREAACQQTARSIAASGVHSVRLSWCDVHGQLRGKTLMAAAAMRGPLRFFAALVMTGTGPKPWG